MGSSRSAEKTSSEHARRLIAERWPGAPVIEAQKSVRWIPNGKGGVRPISGREDFHGVFDFLIHGDDGVVRYIQLTTHHANASGGSASKRKRKIEAWAREQNFHPGCEPVVYVWAWWRRKGILEWELVWETLTWGERRLHPLLPRETALRSRSARETDALTR